VYALLNPNSDAKIVAGQMSKLVHDNFTPPAGTTFSFTLQPLKNIHLDSEDIVDGARNSNVDPLVKGSMFYIKIFSFIAFFLLLIAGINYINLTTARASGRSKEIGVRKAIGALQRNLIRQFLFESLLVTFISFLLSLVVVNLLLPAFNQFTNKQLSLGLSTDYRVWFYAVGFAAITGLLSGSYPALMLSRFKSVLLLKGLKLQDKKGLSLRRGLVVFQFLTAQVLIIGAIVVAKQMNFIQSQPLGFSKNNVVDISLPENKTEQLKLLNDKLSAIPGISGVSFSLGAPVTDNNAFTSFNRKEKSINRKF
jgi:putative ABC transport system permease protein